MEIFETFVWAYHGWIRFLRRLVAELELVLALVALTLTLMLPLPLSIIAHYRHLSPIQKYWFPTYLRSEFSRDAGIYRILVVRDTNENDELANDRNTVPGMTLGEDGYAAPFTLPPKDLEQGKKLILLPATIHDSQDLWGALRRQVYGGRSIGEMGDKGMLIGIVLNCLFYFSFVIAFFLYLTARVVEVGSRLLRRGSKYQITSAGV